MNVSARPFSVQDVCKTSAQARHLQPRLLRVINLLNTKEEILEYVSENYQLLDSINLVTCLYRLARLYGIMPVSTQRGVWRSDLLASPGFSLLLGCVHAHLVQAHDLLLAGSGEVQGLNARCISNLVWSVVKLELTAEDGHPLGPKVVHLASPLVACFITDCSPQGLANLLWSFAKIHHVAPAHVMLLVVRRMVEVLESPNTCATVDMQALSNSIWAIAHVQSQSHSIEHEPQWQETVVNFLLLMASRCLLLLNLVMENPLSALSSSSRQPASVELASRSMSTPDTSSVPLAAQEAGPRAASVTDKPVARVSGDSSGGGTQHVTPTSHFAGQEADGKVSCQAIANIAWSYATILGPACAQQDPIRSLFLVIRQLTIAKLSNNATTPTRPVWAHTLAGTFNEQALSNVVFAFDVAQLLSHELLQRVLDAGSQKLGRPNAQAQPRGTLGFKAQELCVLLKACHLGIAQPWKFLNALHRALEHDPSATNDWSEEELAELCRALDLLNSNIDAASTALLEQDIYLIDGLSLSSTTQPQQPTTSSVGGSSSRVFLYPTPPDAQQASVPFPPAASMTTAQQQHQQQQHREVMRTISHRGPGLAGLPPGVVQADSANFMRHHQQNHSVSFTLHPPQQPQDAGFVHQQLAGFGGSSATQGRLPLLLSSQSAPSVGINSSVEVNSLLQNGNIQMALSASGVPSFALQPQQVWVRGADGQLKSATLLLAQTAPGGAVSSQSLHTSAMAPALLSGAGALSSASLPQQQQHLW